MQVQSRKTLPSLSRIFFPLPGDIFCRETQLCYTFERWKGERDLQVHQLLFLEKRQKIEAEDYSQESLIYPGEVQMVSKGKYLFFTQVNYYSLCQGEVFKSVKGNI